MQHPVDHRRVEQRPDAVVDQHQFRRIGGQTLEAEPYQFLPRRAAWHRIQQVQIPGRLGIECRVVGVHHRAHPIDAGMSAQALQTMA